MKKIALDLDGVVFDSENLYRIYTEIYDIEKFKKDNIIHNEKRLFQERYNWPDEEFSKFYQENAQTILKIAPLMTGIDIVLSRLKSQYSFIIITARKNEELEYAKEKLQEIGLFNVPIYDNEHKKIDRCIKENIDYIIDDSEEICKQASKQHIHAIYLKNNASEKLPENKYLKTVHNWGEIYKYLYLTNMSD